MICGKKIRPSFFSQWIRHNQFAFASRFSTTSSQRYKSWLNPLPSSSPKTGLSLAFIPKLPKLHTHLNFVTCLQPHANPFSIYSQSSNKLINESERLTSGLFGNPAFKSPESICEYAKDRSEQAHFLVQKILTKGAVLENSPSSWQLNDTIELIDSFDILSNTICLCTDAAELIRTLHPDPSYIQAAETAYNFLSSIVHTLNTHTGLYHILSNALKLHASKLTPMQRHNAQVFLRDFESAGIHLSQQHHRKYALLSNEISHHMREFLTFHFPPLTVNLEKAEWNNVRKNRLFEASFPSHSLASSISENTSPFTVKDDHIELKLSYSHAHSILSASGLSSVRQKIFNAIHAPHSQQEKNLTALLTKRYQLANLLGHRSFADWFSKDKMLDSPEKVAFFLNCEAKHLLLRLDSTFRTMLHHQIQEYSCVFEKAHGIRPWDTSFFLSKQTSLSKLPYWSTSPFNVFTVFQRLIQKLYNVECVSSPCSMNETWDPSITKWTLSHGDQGLLGTIYCDARSHDSSCLNQAAHFTVQCKSTLSNQPGVVVIRLPFQTSHDPSWRWPHVETAYHELGHAMHALLSLTPYQNTSGTRCAFDLGEIPSILMELLAEDPWTRSQFSTAAPMPISMTPWDSAQQLLSSIYDLSLHSTWTPSLPLETWFDQLHTRPEMIFGSNSPYLCEFLRCIPWTSGMRPYLRFQHLATYASGYYTYLWCRKLAKCIYQRLFQNQHDLWTSHGEVLWKEFLGWGGGRDPWECIGVILQEMDREKLFHQICESPH